jgi:hypothetical protein
MTSIQAMPPSAGVRYFSGASSSGRAGPGDLDRVLDVLDAPGGAAVGRASLAGWARGRLGHEATWCLAIGERPLWALFFLRGDEFVPALAAP